MTLKTVIVALLIVTTKHFVTGKSTFFCNSHSFLCKCLDVTNDRSEARVDPLATLFVQGQTGKNQAEVSRAT